MPLELETLTVGPLEVNCYLAGCDTHKVCFVFDRGDASQRSLRTIEEKGWEVGRIINTHGHADHTGGNLAVKEATGAALGIHKLDAVLLTNPEQKDIAGYLGVKPSPEPDELFEDGQTIELCPCVCFTLIGSPGHTPGGACFRHENTVITGDTLFRMSIGRTDLPGGNHAQLLNSLTTKLFTLPDDVAVYPGHGEPTTIGYEKKNNPFANGTFQ